MDREELDPFAEKMIAITARRMIGKCGFREDDLEDIQQELWTVILINAGKFDGDFFSMPKLVVVSIKNASKNILRDRVRAVRYSGSPTVSIDRLIDIGWDPHDNGSWEELMDVIIDRNITLPED